MQTNELYELLRQIKADIDEIKKNQMAAAAARVSDKWVPRPFVMNFFDYENTQIAEFERIDGVIVSQIGRRKFFHRESISKLLDNNIINP